jgi:hypothetical protein
LPVSVARQDPASRRSWSSTAEMAGSRVMRGGAVVTTGKRWSMGAAEDPLAAEMRLVGERAVAWLRGDVIQALAPVADLDREVFRVAASTRTVTQRVQWRSCSAQCSPSRR